MPIQLPTKFELIANIKTARAPGLTIPPTILVLTDEMIKGTRHFYLLLLAFNGRRRLAEWPLCATSRRLGRVFRQSQTARSLQLIRWRSGNEEASLGPAD